MKRRPKNWLERHQPIVAALIGALAIVIAALIGKP
jgi:hypothetical protein